MPGFMPLQSLALVITAALLHARWNVAAKKAGGDQRFALLTVLITLVLRAPVALWVGVGEMGRWGFLSGTLIAAYTVIDGYAVKLLLIGPVPVDDLGNVLRMMACGVAALAWG